MSNHVLRSYVSNWQATSPTQAASWPFILLCLTAVATLPLGLRRRRSRVWKAEGAVALGLTATAFYTARYAVWAVIGLAYVCSVHGPKLAVRLPRRPIIIARVA